MNPYATHIPVLLRCLQGTNGPILEMGSGIYSTPLIAAFARGDRFAMTVEANRRYARRALSMIGSNHRLLCAPYQDAPIESTEWDVVLIDHAPAARRQHDLARVAEHSRVVICHDSDGAEYGWDWAKFLWHWEFQRLTPKTMVLSQSPIEWISTPPLVPPNREQAVETTPTSD